MNDPNMTEQALETLQAIARHLSNRIFGLTDFEYTFCNPFIVDQLLVARTPGQAIRFGQQMLNDESPRSLKTFTEMCDARDRWGDSE